MINVDDRLINELMPGKIGVDAFAILMAIASHLGKKGKVAWPGIDRLRNMCKVEVKGELRAMPRLRAYNAIARLIESGVVDRWQDNFDGNFGKTKYRITTDYLGVWLGASGFHFEEQSEKNNRYAEFDETVSKYRNTENRNTENRNTEFGNTEVINEVEVVNETGNELTKGKNARAKFQPPSIDEVFSYLTNEKQIDPSTARRESEKFHAFYESNGWKVGKNKMQKWKAAAAGWISRMNDYSPTTKQTSNGQADQPRHLVDEETARKALARLHARGYK